jgi:hypothetical protein
MTPTGLPGTDGKCGWQNGNPPCLPMQGMTCCSINGFVPIHTVAGRPLSLRLATVFAGTTRLSECYLSKLSLSHVIITNDVLDIAASKVTAANTAASIHANLLLHPVHRKLPHLLHPYLQLPKMQIQVPHLQPSYLQP